MDIVSTLVLGREGYLVENVILDKYLVYFWKVTKINNYGDNIRPIGIFSLTKAKSITRMIIF